MQAYVGHFAPILADSPTLPKTESASPSSVLHPRTRPRTRLVCTSITTAK